MAANKSLKMVHTDLIHEDQLIVDFSDGTSAAFTTQDLISSAGRRFRTDSDDVRPENNGA